MGQRSGIPCILELAEHLGVREYLSGVIACQLEQPPQQCRLVHPREEQHIPSNRCLDKGIEDVARPALRISNQWGSAGVAAVEQVRVEIPAKAGTHLREGPVGKVENLESPGKALRQTSLDEQWSGSKQDHLEIASRSHVFVPQTFYRLRPADDLLNLVKSENNLFHAFPALQKACRVPLLLDPLASA